MPLRTAAALILLVAVLFLTLAVFNPNLASLVFFLGLPLLLILFVILTLRITWPSRTLLATARAAYQQALEHTEPRYDFMPLVFPPTFKLEPVLVGLSQSVDPPLSLAKDWLRDLFTNHKFHQAHGEYQIQLKESIAFYEGAAARQDALQKTVGAIMRAFELQLDALIPNHDIEPLAFIDFVELADVPHLVQVIKDACFTPEIINHNLLPELRHQLNTNRLNATAALVGNKAYQGAPHINPEDHPGTPQEIIRSYLSDTPFASLFDFTLPYRLPLKQRFEHMHIVADPGHGKTQTLERMIVQDMNVAKVIIDPHSVMLERVAHLRELKDKLVIIDADDDPALNLFDANLERYANATERVRENAVEAILETSSYFFSALSENEFSGKMRYVYANLAYLMMYIPGATPDTLLEVLEKGPPTDTTATLPPKSQKFIEELTRKNSPHQETKDGIKWRVDDLIRKPSFGRMFSASRNMVDLDDILATGKTLLIGGKGLGERHIAVLGRLFIAKTLQAAVTRANPTPAFLYIDEAHLFFNKSVSDIIEQARKFQLGLILSHQRLSQASSDLQSALNLTHLRLAAGREAKHMAPGMNTTADFIASMQTRPPKEADWALYDQKSFNKAAKVTIPHLTLDRQPLLTEPEYQQLRRENRERLRAPPAASARPPIVETEINIGPGDR